MRRVAIVLVLSLAAAGTAEAQSYGGGGWRRVHAGGETFWVASADIERAQQRPGGRKRVRILDLDPAPAEDGTPLRYQIIDRTYDCDAGGAEDVVTPYGSRGERREDEPRPEVEVDPEGRGGALFQIVCEGAAPYDDVELESVRDVIAFESRSAISGGYFESDAPEMQGPPADDWDPDGPGLGGDAYEAPEREDFEPSPEDFEEPDMEPGDAAYDEETPGAWEPETN